MASSSDYRSILEEAADFFEPVKRCNKGKVNLLELKQLMDERRQEQITGQKVGEALIKKELGLSYQEAIKKQSTLKNNTHDDKLLEEQDQVQNEAQALEDIAEDGAGFYMTVIMPQAKTSVAIQQDDCFVRDLMDGFLLQRCKFFRKCSKDVAVGLIQQSVQIRQGFLQSHTAMELYVALLSNKGGGGFLDKQIEYIHEFVPDCAYFLELFAELGQYDGNCQEGQEATVIVQQVKNWLSIICAVSTRQRSSLNNEQISQWQNLFIKIVILQLDQKFEILQADIYKTVKSVIWWLDNKQWQQSVSRLLEKLLDEIPNLSSVVRVAERIPIIDAESFQDRGQILKSEISFQAFCKYYPIQKDISQVVSQKGNKRSRNKFEEIPQNHLQNILDIFQQQISPKKLLEKFVSKNSNNSDYVTLKHCLYLLEQVSWVYVRNFCYKKKKGEQVNEEQLQNTWNMIDYMKSLCSALQQRKGNDVERLQAKDAASTLQLHTKWSIEQFD